MRKYGTILAAIDGTESSRDVLAHARAIAAIVDVEVIVYHVVQKAYSGAATIYVGLPTEISVDDAVAELQADGIRARPLEEEAFWKHTARTIVEAATRESAGLIVMGSRGRSKLPALMLGSVAYEVLHRSSLPVLVIPDEATAPAPRP